MKISEYVNAESETITKGNEKLWIEPVKDCGYSYMQLGEKFNKKEWLATGYAFVELLDNATDDILTSGCYDLNSDIEDIYNDLMQYA